MKLVLNRPRHTSMLGCALAATLAALTTVPAQAQRPAQHPAAPVAGGSIAVRAPAVPDCLDPQKTAQSASAQIFSSVVDTLVSADEHGHIRPYLAERYQFSPDGKTVTFFLHHGLRFSNGDPLDARAVKFTFDRAVNPGTKSPITAALLSTIKATEVVDPYAVRLLLAQPYRPLLTQLTLGYTGILDPAMDNAGSPDPCRYPIGSGPFKVQSVGPGFSAVTLVRNPLHSLNPPWAHHQGPAYLDTIVWKPIVSDTTATSALLTGATDVDTNVAGSQLGRLHGNTAMILHRAPQLGEMFLGFNLAHAPFTQLAVRRAVAQAIDRTAVIKAAANGLAVPAYSSIPPTLPFYDSRALGYAPRYDPVAARRAIAAGHATGPYTLLTFAIPEFSTAAELIQAELAQVGMDVRIVTKPVAAFFSVAGKGQFDLIIESWGWPDPDFLYQLFDSSQEAAGGLNYTFYRSATLDNLIVRGRTTVDVRAAARVYTQLQRFMDQNVIVDPLLTDETVYAVRASIRGWHQDNGGLPLFQDLFVAS
jgi:peptide/nickel transport system substrate-binding protein